MVLDLGGRVGASVALLLTACMGVVFASFGPSQYFDWSFVKQESASTGLALTVVSIPVAAACFWVAMTHAFRLFSAEPDAIIDETGLALQPWIAPDKIPWSEISASRVKQVDSGRAGIFWHLEIELKTPVRALATCYWPARKIALGSRYSTGIKEAGRFVRHYRQLAGWKR